MMGLRGLVYQTMIVLALIGGIASGQKHSATISVDVAKVVGKFSPLIVGQNIIGYQQTAAQTSSLEYSNRGAGLWDPESGRTDSLMVVLAREAGASVARYPGGCAVHLFDWKKTVGPASQRPQQLFGLPEFMQACTDMNAVPLITMSDYFGSPQDAADLVEYLNAPDDGKHPWAAKRRADGHEEPWDVKWFEYGNESYHGNHLGYSMSPREYSESYVRYKNSMKVIDPRIKLGAVVGAFGGYYSEWSKPIVDLIGKEMDFAIIHCYAPDYGGQIDSAGAEFLFKTGLTCKEQIQEYFDRVNKLLKGATGKTQVPIAVTEFNGMFHQDRPIPYRHSLGNALIIAEMLQVFMEPANNIFMATFWQFSNEYWGAVKGYSYKKEQLVKRPQFYVSAVFRLLAGNNILQVNTQSETYETSGGFGLQPARGTGNKQRQALPDPVTLSPWELSPSDQIIQKVSDDTLVVGFNSGEDINYYHARKVFSAKSNSSYHLSAWVRTEKLSSGNGVWLQMGDGRGWDATHSIAHSPQVKGTTPWNRVECDYHSLPDTREIEILARREKGGGRLEGEAFFRDIEINRYEDPVFPAEPYLSAVATMVKAQPNAPNSDNIIVRIMVVSKHMDAETSAKIDLRNCLPLSARVSCLSGPSIDATNEGDPSSVVVRQYSLGEVKNGFELTVAPHSLTLIELEGTR